MDRVRIQEKARELQIEIWENRNSLWPNGTPSPLDMLCPDIAAAVLGVEYVESPTVSQNVFISNGKKHHTAGLYDSQSNKIAISTEFQNKVMRFTGAHEIGHVVLHKNHDLRMHRDMPIDGSQKSNLPLPPIEKEANYFASCFLMPEKLVIKYLRKLFKMELPFVINENVAFHLNPSDPDALVHAEENSVEREMAIAKCTSFNGRSFQSLSDIFGVSVPAMAIRLKELQVIRWP